MDPSEFGRLDRATWRDVLDDALTELTEPAAALRAWSAAGMLRAYDDAPPPTELVRPETVRAACIALKSRRPAALVGRAVDTAGDLADEERIEIWLRFSADAAAVSAMRGALTRLGRSPELAADMNEAVRVQTEWERAIRMHWLELATHGLELARASVRSWTTQSMLPEAELLLDVVDFARERASDPAGACSWGFGERRARDHATKSDAESTFAEHLGLCTVCSRRVRVAAKPNQVTARVIRFARPMALAAASPAAAWRHEGIVPELGTVKIWINPDGVMAVAPQAFDEVEWVRLGELPMRRDDTNRLFALRIDSPLSREQAWLSDVVVGLSRGGDPLILRRPNDDA